MMKKSCSYILLLLIITPFQIYAFEDTYCATNFDAYPLFNGQFEILGSSPPHWVNENNMYMWTQGGSQGFISDTDLGYPSGYSTNDYAWNQDYLTNVVIGDYYETVDGVDYLSGQITSGACGEEEEPPIDTTYATSTCYAQYGTSTCGIITELNNIRFILSIFLVIALYISISHIYYMIFPSRIPLK